MTIVGGTLGGSGTGAIRIGTQSFLQDVTITARVVVPANATATLNAGIMVNDGLVRITGAAGIALIGLCRLKASLAPVAST